MLEYLHELKIRLCLWLLACLEPNTHKIIGEAIADALEDKTKQWEVALLSIQAEVAEEFDGGLLHGVPSVAALCQKIRQETRAWRLQNVRERKLVNILDLEQPGQIVPRVRGLVKIDFTRERERKVFDDALIEVRAAKNAFNHALVLLNELQRSFDLEYRVHNVLDFEEKLESEGQNGI